MTVQFREILPVSKTEDLLLAVL